MSDQINPIPDAGVHTQKKKLPYALRYAIIAVLMYAVYSLIMYFAGQEYNRSLQWVGMLFPLVLVFICLNTYKKDNFHRMTFGQGFGMGMLFFVVFAVAAAVYSFIYINVINPDFVDVMMDMTMERLEDRGLSDEQIESSMAITAKFMTPGAMMIIGIVTNLIMGLFISLIAAAITKSHHDN